MKSSIIPIIVVAFFSVSLPACNTKTEVRHKVVATNPQIKNVAITQQYVGQIQSQHHIKVRALERGYLEVIPLKQGQHVKEGELIFKIIPALHQGMLDAELAEVQLAQHQLDDAKKKFENNTVSQNEVAVQNAKLARAQAKLVAIESTFATVKAPFDGVVGNLTHPRGSLVERGETLTTLSDNSVLWVYFSLPEASYLEYMSDLKQHKEDQQIELVMANGNKFQHTGKIGAIVANFNKQTGTIPFRADFPNPDRLLRHGQTGTVLINRVIHDAVVVPQRATFETLGKRYVYIVDNQNVARQREIVVQNELDDIFVIKNGVGVDDKIVLDGVRQIRDGDKLDYEDRHPEQIASHLK